MNIQRVEEILTQLDEVPGELRDLEDALSGWSGKSPHNAFADEVSDLLRELRSLLTTS